jgi:methionyl-tRNA formyltransferase
VVVVATQPDRPRGAGRGLAVAGRRDRRRSDIPVLRPEQAASLPSPRRQRGFDADLGIVNAFWQFLPKRIRELPRRGYLINAHASILPRHCSARRSLGDPRG